MSSLYKIWTIALYELKILSRSWYFKIFAFIGIFLLFYGNLQSTLALFGYYFWFLRAIPSSIPLRNVIIENVIQAIIAIFLASSFFRRDSKEDTTEIVYMRSMSNAEYILGKVLGGLLLFAIFNIVYLLLTLIFHLLSKIPVDFTVYFIYPILISLPTLIFIFGLSFFLIHLIRNQALVIFILGGYIAIVLFFVTDAAHYFFDYIATYIPLFYSDIAGFGNNFSIILLQRAFYLCAGLGLIFTTVLLFKRLSQSAVMNRISFVLSITFLAISGIIAYSYFGYYNNESELRSQMMELNQKYEQLAGIIQPLAYDIDLVHDGAAIKCTANITFENTTNSDINEVVFNLNPDLKVKSIKCANGNIDFTREKHLIKIEFPHAIRPQTADSIEIEYEGGINDRVAYLDIDEAERVQHKARFALCTANKNYSFLNSNYLLLTSENMWYPVPGVTYNPKKPFSQHDNFSFFDLTVTTRPNLIAISQGKVTQIEKGKYHFKSGNPNLKISLVIGEYEQKSIVVDGIEYNAFIYKNHDFYTENFSSLKDVMPEVIRDCKSTFENNIKIGKYPFKRFSIVEVPVQYYCYPRFWSTSKENVQPEMVFMHEKSITITEADFKLRRKIHEIEAKRQGEILTQQENERKLFKFYMDYSILNLDMANFFGDYTYHNFANYFTYAYQLKSEQTPILDLALKTYMANRFKEQEHEHHITHTKNIGFHIRSYQTLDALSKNILANYTILEMLDNIDDKEIINEVIKRKSIFLFLLLQEYITKENFQEFLKTYMENGRFKSMSGDEFIFELNQYPDINFNEILGNWYTDKSLPGYLLKNVEYCKLYDNNKIKNQVKLVIENCENTDGIVKFSFRKSWDFQQRHDLSSEKVYSIKANETKEIGMLLDYDPVCLNTNTLVSKNIPTIIESGFGPFEMNRDAKPFSGERVIPSVSEEEAEDAIIIDNEDSGFSILNNSMSTFFQKALASSAKSEFKYTEFDYNNPPNNWREGVHQEFYGKYVRSAYFCKAGDGKLGVAWHTNISDNATYSVYFFYGNPWMPDEISAINAKGHYNFTIQYGNTSKEISVEIKDLFHGWNHLGNYALPEGEITVALNNKSEGILVIADAVKLVKN